MSLPEQTERSARMTIRVNIEDPDARVDSCRVADCDIQFIGMTAEDYAAHLVDHHSFYRRASRRVILRSVCEAINRTQDTGMERDDTPETEGN